MANDKRAEVEVELFDKKTNSLRPYVLRFEFNDICEIDKALGHSVIKLAGEGNFGAHVLRQCIWQALKKRNRQLRVGDVGGMIPGGGFIELAQKVGEAITMAIGLDLDAEDSEGEAMDPTEEEEEEEEETYSTGTD